MADGPLRDPLDPDRLIARAIESVLDAVPELPGGDLLAAEASPKSQPWAETAAPPASDKRPLETVLAEYEARVAARREPAPGIPTSRTRARRTREALAGVPYCGETAEAALAGRRKRRGGRAVAAAVAAGRRWRFRVSGVGEGSCSSIDGILFDYGETLVEFTRPDDALAAAEVRMLAVLSDAGEGGMSIEGLRAVLDRVDREVASTNVVSPWRRSDLAAVSLRAYEDAGVILDGALLDEMLRIEQEAWWHGAHVDPDAVPLLDLLRCRDIRVGLCSNAPYRARSLHEQLAFVGLDGHLDAVTFSAEVGWRKPAPQIFRAALRALGTGADRTVMVGDFETADIAGAHAAGMRAVRINRR